MGSSANTRFLMEVLGWSGVYFEPDIDSFSRLSERLQNRDDVLTLREFVDTGQCEHPFCSSCGAGGNSTCCRSTLMARIIGYGTP